MFIVDVVGFLIYKGCVDKLNICGILCFKVIKYVFSQRYEMYMEKLCKYVIEFVFLIKNILLKILLREFFVLMNGYNI